MEKKALLSVSNKEGIIPFAKELSENGYQILATGNTAKIIRENNIPCTDISDYTNFPEVFSGRVKTLHPKVLGGILQRRDNENDIKQAEENDIPTIDIVCINLYPFAEVVNKKDVDEQTKIENIDIGGPSLIRAAAKNYKFVSVLTSHEQYKDFLYKLTNHKIDLETRKQLAAEAFAHTANYDKLIADYFEKELLNENRTLRINLLKVKELRYGENPHQKAYLYGNFFDYFEVVHGKELSYNNIIDLEASVNLVSELDENSCVIVKHTNPCGAATAANIYDAYINALSCDPVSAFGGIVSFNKNVDKKVAEKLNEIFTEVIAAPSFDEDALTILRKKKNRRLVKILKNENNTKLNIKTITGGMISQTKDDSVFPDNNYKVVTDKKVTAGELKNLKFAWKVCKHTKSNAIVFAKDMKAIGVGGGQMSRVDSSRIAVQKAKQHNHNLQGAVAASDAFFPFADGVEEIAENGITAIVQPGGSIRDQEVIEAANQNGISMIFTGIRNFKH